MLHSHAGPGRALAARAARARGLLRSLLIYWRPGRQRGLRRLYAPFVAAGDLVFDIGAHVGDRSVAFAALGARVIALEPQPACTRWLGRVARRHAGIRVIASAAGAKSGSATLAVSRASPTVSTLATDWRRRIGRSNPGFRQVRWEDEITVPVTTLDDLIRAHGRPTFCKIDVEGYEAEVLAGLSASIPAVSFEFVAGTTDIARACITRLGALGDYEYNTIAGEQRRFRFPQWISAPSLDHWLERGAEGIASGDVYARLRHTLR